MVRIAAADGSGSHSRAATDNNRSQLAAAAEAKNHRTMCRVRETAATGVLVVEVVAFLSLTL